MPTGQKRASDLITDGLSHCGFWKLNSGPLVEQSVLLTSEPFFCDILVKNITALCPCPKILPEAKVKRYGLIVLAKEILK